MNFRISKKIFHLVNTGFNNDIENLISSIPLDLRNKEFDKKYFYLRLNSFDIPHVCNNISKMLATGDNLIFIGRYLLFVNLFQKQEEAMLALELLENDIESEDKFVDNIINYLENIKNENFNVLWGLKWKIIY